MATPTAAAATTPDAASVNTSANVLWVQYLMLIGYSVMCGLCLLLLCYLRLNRHVAFRGDERAARKIILPAYEPLLFLLAIETAGFAIFTGVALSTKRYTTYVSVIDSEVYYAGRQFVFVTVIVFILQKSVSVPALRRTMLISLVLASYTVPIVWVLSEYYPATSHTAYWITFSGRRLLLLLYGYVFFKPPTRASVKSLRAYCIYVVLYHCIIMTSSTVSHYHVASSAVDFFSCAVIAWGSLCPLWIWHVLRADTEYWRGMGWRACALQANFRQRPAINEHLSSHGLHVLIEMHRKYVIDFAHLEVKSPIGMGSSATVFSGLLKSQRPVAIKTYTPHNFTEETVAQFSHEAAFCATLHHPNIVEFIGMCVSPPTISLVVELCKATLEDLLLTQAHRAQNEQQQLAVSCRRRSRERVDTQAPLQVAYMVDAARAVAYLHSFSPPLLHRDLKPANFLVDVDNNIKLADFGESRQLPRQQVPASYFEQSHQRLSNQLSSGSDFFSQQATSFDPFGAVAPRQTTPAAMMTVTGTVHYMPPEMIRGRSGLAAYGQAADVFSLAITLWDILYPQRSKYPEIRDSTNHFLVLEGVLAGSRPEFDADAHPKLRDLISCGWHADPNYRPSAQQMVSALESIQEEILSGLAMELCDDFDRSTAASGADDQQSVDSICSVDIENITSFGSNALPNVRMNPHNNCFSGEHAVERMETLFDVDPQSGESIRLGNALMDAGFLHHSTHSQSFEGCGTATYFFDSDNIQFCQPLAILEEKCRFDDDESSSETLFSPSLKDEGDGETSTREFRIDLVSQLLPPGRANTLPQHKQRSRSRLLSRITSTFLNVTAPGDGGSRRNLGQGCYDYYQGRCLCRRYGQRVETARSIPNAQRARQDRLNRIDISPSAITEEDEDTLMRKLLADDSIAMREDSEGFVQIVTPAA